MALLGRYAGWDDAPSLLLVGLAGSFFAYEPILTCLQKLEEVPFRDELLLRVAEPPPPEYEGAQQLQRQLDRQLAADNIQLDAAQRDAFEHACASRLALIVGPPGTGKSFVGSELAWAILQATELRLLLVCYTNHALDQCLLHLLNKGERRMVRIGGRSREPRLEEFSFFSLKSKNNEDRDRVEMRRVYDIRDSMEPLRK